MTPKRLEQIVQDRKNEVLLGPVTINEMIAALVEYHRLLTLLGYADYLKEHPAEFGAGFDPVPPGGERINGGVLVQVKLEDL